MKDNKPILCPHCGEVMEMEYEYVEGIAVDCYYICRNCFAMKSDPPNNHRRRKMTGCEWIKCSDYINGKCHNELDFVNEETGEPMCPYNTSAIPREDFYSTQHEV